MSKTRHLKITTENNWEYFAKSTGGNNREWAKRYRDMLNNFEMLKKSGCDDKFLEGYRACLDLFHRRDNLIVNKGE